MKHYDLMRGSPFDNGLVGYGILPLSAFDKPSSRVLDLSASEAPVWKDKRSQVQGHGKVRRLGVCVTVAQRPLSHRTRRRVRLVSERRWHSYYDQVGKALEDVLALSSLRPQHLAGPGDVVWTTPTGVFGTLPCGMRVAAPNFPSFVSWSLWEGLDVR